MSEWASSAPMMAFKSSLLRSGELANCSLVLTMGHGFRASHAGEGRVFVEAVEWED
jgi:hypothetical protein